MNQMPPPPDPSTRVPDHTYGGYYTEPDNQHGIPVPRPEPAKPKRRVFMWFFLAVQALFGLWLVTGLAAAGDTADDCATEACRDGAAVGTAIGVIFILIMWMLVSGLLALGRWIYKTARS